MFSPLINQLVTNLLQLAITAAVPVLAVALFKAIAPFVARANLFIDENNLAAVRDLIETGVLAAEQKFLGPDNGAAKKAYVLSVVQKALEARGIDIPVEQLEAELEAAIKQGLQGQAVPTEPAPVPADPTPAAPSLAG